MATPERYNALLKNCNYLLNLLLLLSKIKIWCPQKIKFLLFEYFIELSLGLHCPEWPHYRPHPSCTPAPKPHPLNITIISTGSSHMLSFPHLHHQYLYNTLYVQAVVILLGLGTLKIKALFLWKWELHTWFANAPTLSGPQISHSVTSILLHTHSCFLYCQRPHSYKGKCHIFLHFSTTEQCAVKELWAIHIRTWL